MSARRRRSARCDARPEHRHFDVRARGQRSEQQVSLEHEADELPAGPGGPGLLPDGAAVDLISPLSGCSRPPISASSVLLPGTRTPRDRDRLAACTRIETPRSELTRPKLLLTRRQTTSAPVRVRRDARCGAHVLTWTG